MHMILSFKAGALDHGNAMACMIWQLSQPISSYECPEVVFVTAFSPVMSAYCQGLKLGSLFDNKFKRHGCSYGRVDRLL